MEEFLQNIYGSFTAPVTTFNKLKQEPLPFYGLIIVAVVSMLSPFFNNMISNTNFSAITILPLAFLSLAAGIISWLIFAGFMELLAFVFDKNGQFKTILTLSAFALIPWILLGPILLLKQAGPVFEGIGILLSLCIFIWTTVLFFLAIAISYNLTVIRCVAFAFIPFICSIIQFYWFVYFIQNFINVVKT